MPTSRARTSNAQACCGSLVRSYVGASHGVPDTAHKLTVHQHATLPGPINDARAASWPRARACFRETSRSATPQAPDAPAFAGRAVATADERLFTALDARDSPAPKQKSSAPTGALLLLGTTAMASESVAQTIGSTWMR